jgi:hypothetical protein
MTLPGRPTRPGSLREPIRNPWFWCGALLFVSAGSPWYLPPGSFEPVLLGVPYWVWISVVLSLGFCLYVRWACLHLWSLPADGEAGPEVREGETP